MTIQSPVMSDSATPWIAAPQSPPSSTISQRLLKFMSIESVMLLTISSSATPFAFNLSQHLGLF